MSNTTITNNTNNITTSTSNTPQSNITITHPITNNNNNTTNNNNNNNIITNEDSNSSIITVTPSVLNNHTTGPLFPISPFNVTNISAISAITEPTNNTLHFTQPPTQQNVSATSVISRCSRRKRKKPLKDHTPLHSSIPNIEPHRKRSKSRKRVGIQNNNNNNNSTTENNNNNNNQSPSIPIPPNPTPNHRNSRNKRKNLSPSLLPYDYDNNNNKNKKRLPLIVNSIILFIFTFLSPIHFKPMTLLCSTTWNGFISSYLSNENTPVIVNDDTSEFKSMIDNSDIDRTYTDYASIFDNNNADNTQLAQSYTDEDIRNYVYNINNKSRRDCIRQHLNIDDSIFNISKIKTKNISKYCKQILYNEQKQIDAQSHLQLNNNNNNNNNINSLLFLIYYIINIKKISKLKIKIHIKLFINHIFRFTTLILCLFIGLIPWFYYQYFCKKSLCSNINTQLYTNRNYCDYWFNIMYSFVQTKYWQCGLCKLWNFNEIGNFILISSIWWITFHTIKHYYIRFLLISQFYNNNNVQLYMNNDILNGITNSNLKSNNNNSNNELLLNHKSIQYTIYSLTSWLISWLIGIYYVHVKILIRFTYCSCPALYWFYAKIIYYKDRISHIKNIQKRYINRQLIWMYHESDDLIDKYNIISIERHEYIERHLLPPDDQPTFYFMQTYNRFMDYDKLLRNLFEEIIGNIGFNICKIMICIRIYIKN